MTTEEEEWGREKIQGRSFSAPSDWRIGPLFSGLSGGEEEGLYCRFLRHSFETAAIGFRVFCLQLFSSPRAFHFLPWGGDFAAPRPVANRVKICPLALPWIFGFFRPLSLGLRGRPSNLILPKKEEGGS